MRLVVGSHTDPPTDRRTRLPFPTSRGQVVVLGVAVEPSSSKPVQRAEQWVAPESQDAFHWHRSLGV